jgi:hypothetical protein
MENGAYHRKQTIAREFLELLKKFKQVAFIGKKKITLSASLGISQRW